MDNSKFHDLPPVKRFTVMQQQEEKTISPPRLPAKKRKVSPNPPPTPPLFTAGNNYYLPAKKRIWALQPFDLNMEYNPPIDAQQSPKKPENIPISGPVVNASEETYVPNKENEVEGVVEIESAAADDDDGIVCAICESTDGDPDDPIVLCDGCDLMVHTSCYGHPFTKTGIPNGDWFCAQCLAAKTKNSSNQFSCCLCPVKGGALKPTTNDNDGEKWAHVVCALFVPEVFFVDPEGKEGIDYSKVPKRRWEKRCYVCNKAKKGCVLDCSEPKCPLAFHVTCGTKEDLCIEYKEGKSKAGSGIVAGFCKTHTDLWKKQQQTGKFKIVARDELER